MRPAICLLTLLALGFAVPEARADDLTSKLKGAAPANLIADASLMDMAQMKVIREGSNGWTCMVHGGVPMCVDAVGLEWVHALMAKAAPPEKIGLICMLKGDAGVSNTDPLPRRKRLTTTGSRPAVTS